MRWSPARPEIGELAGFEGTDLFGYGQFGNHLATLIGALDDNPVLVLDGPWGSGKTTFARQLAGVLRKQGHAVAHFDAFAADHHKDPFLALAEEIHCLAAALGHKDKKILKQFAEGAAAFGEGLVLAALDTTLPRLGRLAERAMEAGSQADLIETWISKAADRRNALDEFRKRLQELADCLAPAKMEDEQGSPARARPETQVQPRLVFIVDELDRCRPSFALALLERIKHVFGVQGVTFLLVANLEELGKSVCKVYGGVDATRYLEKFYEIVVRLPESREAGRHKHRTYVNYLSRELNVTFPTYDLTPTHSLAHLAGLAEKENLSLRSLEHIMRLVLVLAPDASPEEVAGLPFLRVAQPELFERIKRRDSDQITVENLKTIEKLFGRPWNEVEDRLSALARLLDQYRVT